MKNLFKDVNLKIGDTVLASSSVLKIMIHNKNSKNEIDINSIIDMLIEKISAKIPCTVVDYNKIKD
tara:strand:- start:1539 stop:1736 length:198 start_codon:yes stop_codon:yes gene_type:complete